MSEAVVKRKQGGRGSRGGSGTAPVQGLGQAQPALAPQEPDEFAVQIGDQIESFILSVREVAKGDDPDSAVPYLLLEVSQLLLAGGRLGAHEDFVPDERYEPDAGPDRAPRSRSARHARPSRRGARRSPRAGAGTPAAGRGRR